MTEQSYFSQGNQNLLVDNDGKCINLLVNTLEIPEKTYRIYRFLTELEDILDEVPDEFHRIVKIIPLVQKLLTSSYWLSLEIIEPSPKLGWSVCSLYEDYEFDITVQTVAWLPGNVSPIHNHGSWGIVVLLNGQEKHQLWRRVLKDENSNRLELVGEKILCPGDIISFLPDAIHSLEPFGEEPSVSFNLYGVTNFSQRFEFDPITHTAKNF